MSDLALYDPTFATGAMSLAKQLSGSALIPAALRGKPADVLIVLLTGRELGIGPMQAMRGINVIDGKAVMGADLMSALAVSKGEVCEYFRLVETSAKKATYETKRRGAESVRMSWTIEQAQAAGLTGKKNWQTYPEAMLRARCAAALARAVYPDLFMGVYTPEEAEGFGYRPEPTVNGRATDELKAKLTAQLVQSVPVESVTIEEPPHMSPEEAESLLSEEPPTIDSPPQAEPEEPEEQALIPFGKAKGQPLSTATDRDLQFLRKAIGESVEDPAKARFREKNELLLKAIEREIAKR